LEFGHRKKYNKKTSAHLQGNEKIPIFATVMLLSDDKYIADIVEKNICPLFWRSHCPKNRQYSEKGVYGRYILCTQT